MSEFSSREEISRLVKESEEKFNWADAADIYESAIHALLENGEILEAGETQEKRAYCRYRAAYQAETKEEFKTLLDLTSRTYGRAADIYKSWKGPARDARVLTNRALEHFYKSWLIEEPFERKMQVKSPRNLLLMI